MSARVVCPHCGKAIKLRDRSLLGKKGRCPGCNKVFLLEEPTASEDELPPLPVFEPADLRTTSNRAPSKPEPTDVPVPRQPDPLPFSIEPFPTEPLPEFSFDLGETATAPKSSVRSTSRSNSSKSVRRNRSQLPTWIGLGVAAVAVIAGALYLNMQSVPAKKPAAASPVVVPTTPPSPISSPDPSSGPYSYTALTADPNLVAEFRPTHGKPIPLNMLTGVNNIIIHLRPSQLWGAGEAAEELKASLTEDIVHWLESRIEKLTHRSPEQIDELLIGISALSKVEPPQISVVFRLKTPEPRSALIQEFNGEEISSPGKPTVTRQGDFAFFVEGGDTIAISPAAAGEDLSAAVAQPLDCVTDGIAELIKASDRERTLTLFMDLSDAMTYADQLFEPAAQLAITKVIEAFGQDAETVSWSLHLDRTLHSEIRVSPKGIRPDSKRISTADTLKQDYLKTLPALVEHDLVDSVRKMRPAQVGSRQIIGRFPAMVEAFRQATILQPGPKYLTMTTVLPPKAAPNLALGTVLTWDESTRMNFDSSPSDVPIAALDEKLPKTVMERLKTEFEIEFARKPLADAFAYFGEETQVNFVIDGDALKMAGYTKNMPQTFSLGKAPGTKGIYTILTWPMQEKLCLVVDDAKLEALITTTAAAEAQGLKVVPVESLK